MIPGAPEIALALGGGRARRLANGGWLTRCSVPTHGAGKDGWASYPPYGEAFQRKPRLDFQNLFEARHGAKAAP
jgi:hypothetical protein